MAATIGDIIGAVCAFRMAQAQLRYIRRQLDISRRYFNIYSEQRAFYRAVFQSGNSGPYQTFQGSNLVNNPAITGPGLERFYLNEAYGAVAPIKNYAAQRTRADALLFRLRGLTDGQALRRRAEKYGLPTAQYALLELSINASESIVDTTNHFYRATEHVFDVASNRFFERRKNSLNYAVKRINSVSANIGTGYELLNQFRDNAATEMADSFNDTVAGIGFLHGNRAALQNLNTKKMEVVVNNTNDQTSKMVSQYNDDILKDHLSSYMSSYSGMRK